MGENTSYKKYNYEVLAFVSDKALVSYKKCFNWKYTPSCDSDSEIPLGKDSEDDSSVIKIPPLNTCDKPIRVGLSRKQRVSHLHDLKRTGSN